MCGVFRGLVFASKFLFDIYKQCPKFGISFADRPGLRAQCEVALCNHLRFVRELALDIPLGRFPAGKRVAQRTTDAAPIF